VNRSIRSSQASGCQICSHRYEVAYVPGSFGAGFPAPPGLPGPSLPVLNGRNHVCFPRNSGATNTRSGSTAKFATTRRAKIGSDASRSVRYCSFACSTFCRVSGFFNSAVARGMPFRKSVRSSRFPLSACFVAYSSSRTTVSRFAR
jgi:hypothetical protein